MRPLDPIKGLANRVWNLFLDHWIGYLIAAILAAGTTAAVVDCPPQVVHIHCDDRTFEVQGGSNGR